MKWPDAWRFTPDEVARLLTLRQRWRAGMIDERTPEVRRWHFYRWAVLEGLFKR